MDLGTGLVDSNHSNLKAGAGQSLAGVRTWAWWEDRWEFHRSWGFHEYSCQSMKDGPRGYALQSRVAQRRFLRTSDTARSSQCTIESGCPVATQREPNLLTNTIQGCRAPNGAPPTDGPLGGTWPIDRPYRRSIGSYGRLETCLYVPTECLKWGSDDHICARILS